MKTILIMVVGGVLGAGIAVPVMRHASNRSAPGAPSPTTVVMVPRIETPRMVSARIAAAAGSAAPAPAVPPAVPTSLEERPTNGERRAPQYDSEKIEVAARQPAVVPRPAPAPAAKQDQDPARAYTRLTDKVNAVIDALDRLNGMLEDRTGHTAPPPARQHEESAQQKETTP